MKSWSDYSKYGSMSQIQTIPIQGSRMYVSVDQARPYIELGCQDNSCGLIQLKVATVRMTGFCGRKSYTLFT